MITFPDFYEGGCEDSELVVHDLFTVQANRAAAGLTGVTVVPWLPRGDKLESALAAGNGFLRAQRVGGTINLETRRYSDQSRVSIAAITAKRETSWQLIEYVRQVLYAYREGGHVRRADSSTTFMTVPGEVVGPQLIPEQVRDERLVPVLFEIHTDRRGGLPDYRESLGLDD